MKSVRKEKVEQGKGIGNDSMETDTAKGRRQFAILNWVFKVGSLTFNQTVERDKGTN